MASSEHLTTNSVSQTADEKIAHSGAIGWMAKHGVAPKLLMVLLIIGGLLSSLTIRKEFLPLASADIITISISYPGATPSEIEQSILIPVENALAEVEEIETLTSQGFEGSGSVFAEIATGSDLFTTYQTVAQEIGKITTFPVGIDPPRINIPAVTSSVMKLMLAADVDPSTLKKLAVSAQQKLQLRPEITQITIEDMDDEEIHIEFDQLTLQRYNLSLTEVAQTVRTNAIEQSAGSVRSEGGDILVTVDDRIYWAEQFRQIPIVTDRSGVQLILGDIATVREGFNNDQHPLTLNNKPAVVLRIFKNVNQSPIDVTTAVREQIVEIEKTFPESAEFFITSDRGEQYEQRLGLVLKNAFIGLVLVLLLLSLFLHYKLAFWVTLSIPTSFLGALLVLPVFDVSINMITMFSFIIALGLVVDDAIIAGENIYQRLQQGSHPLDAAIAGAKQVAVPLSFAILTNIVAFLPLLVLPNVMGKLFFSIPVVVISCFVISWIEALYILPAHLARIKNAEQTNNKKWIERIQQRVDSALQLFISRVYTRWVARCVSWPSLTISVAVGLAILIFAYVSSGRMGSSLFPQIEGSTAQVEAMLSVDANLQTKQQVGDQLQAALFEMERLYTGEAGSLVVAVERKLLASSVLVTAHLVGIEERDVTTKQVAKLWRENVGNIPAARSLRFRSSANIGPNQDSSIGIELHSNDDSQLRLASDLLAAQLQEYDEVAEVFNGLTNGKLKWDLELTEVGRGLGLQTDDVARQLRAALYGAFALRQSRQQSEVTVLVRLSEQERQRVGDIEQLLIRTPAGNYVPLGEITTLNKTRSQTSVRRVDGRRIIRVYADLVSDKRAPAMMRTLNTEIIPALKERFPAIDVKYSDRQKRQRQSFDVLVKYSFLALIAMFALLAVPLKSYSQPILVMILIPFGGAGAILGHMILGEGWSMLSAMGVVALTGLVINDSLILIDYANRQKQRGLSAKDAIISASVRRFRPVLLTTLTTFFGLAPMVFETSIQAQFISPMAISLGFGILLTTVVCLLVLPAFYIVHDQIISLGHRPNTKESVGDVLPAE